LLHFLFLLYQNYFVCIGLYLNISADTNGVQLENLANCYPTRGSLGTEEKPVF